MRYIILLILLAFSQGFFSDINSLAQVNTGRLDFEMPDFRNEPTDPIERTREEIIAQGIEQYKKAMQFETNDPVNAYRNYIFANYNYHKAAKKKYRKLEKKLSKEQLGDVSYEVASIIAVTMNSTVELREINVLKTLRPNDMYKHQIEWLEKAVKNDHTAAMLDLAEDRANMQREGQALKLLKKAAKLGNLDADYQLAIRYLYGNGVDKDREFARELVEKLAAKNHEPSKYALSSIHYFPEVLAEQGNLEAQNIVATNLFKNALRNMINGRYGAKDRSPDLFAHSWYWFEKAAEQGSGYAMHFIAMYNYYGLGTEKSEALFVKWLKDAAQTDYEPAKVNIGYLIENGIGFQKSEQKAMEIYTKNANDDVVGAQSILGRLYKSGELVGKDLKKSLYWLNKAAEKNDKVSQYLLCTYYSEGPEQSRDYIEAYKWLRIFTSGRDVYLTGPDGIMLATPHMMKSIKIIASKLTQEQKEATEKKAREWINAHPLEEQSLLTRNYLGIYRNVDLHVW